MKFLSDEMAAVKTAILEIKTKLANMSSSNLNDIVEVQLTQNAEEYAISVDDEDEVRENNPDISVTSTEEFIPETSKNHPN